MNSNERKERIHHLRMQEERKRKLPDLLGLISKLSSCKISESYVLSIEQGQALRGQLDHSLYQAAFSVSFPLAQISKLQSILIQSSLLNQQNYMTTSRYQDMAILNIDTAWVTEHLLELLEYDGDTISIYDLPLGNMLWIDYNEGTWHEGGTSIRTWIYELRGVYGKAWMESAYRAYKDLI